MDDDSYACYYYDEYGHAAAFVLMHSEKVNVLCIFEKKSTGEWYLKAKSSDAVLQSGRIPHISAEIYDQFDVGYLDEERQVNLDLIFERRNGNWYVWNINTLSQNQEYISIYIYEKKLVYLEEIKNWKKTTVQGITAYLFSQFNLGSFPMSVQAAMDILSLPPDIPTSNMNYALPQPQSVNFSVNKIYPVYSGPGEQYIRPANGKACVSTNDWVQVFGRCDDWLLIQYHISGSQMRFGYITSSSLPKSATVDEMAFVGFPCEVIEDTSLTDDPLGSRKELCSLLSGLSGCTFLGCLGDEWAYIEVNDVNNGLQRGFVTMNALRITFPTL